MDFKWKSDKLVETMLKKENLKIDFPSFYLSSALYSFIVVPGDRRTLIFESMFDSFPILIHFLQVIVALLDTRGPHSPPPALPLSLLLRQTQ